MEKKSIAKNYYFLSILLAAMVLGCILGWIAPDIALLIAPLGKIFINMMFCIVVPLVFSSISGSVAGMENRKRAGKIMGTTVATFAVTGAIAAIIMFVLMKIFPPVLTAWEAVPREEMGEYASLSQMVINFFTAEDFVSLLSRRAMLPLIVFSVIFGFAANLAGEKGLPIVEWLHSLTEVMMRFVQIVTWYAPIAFFAIFAELVANYGTQITQAYGRAMLIYYPLCFIYIYLQHFHSLHGLAAVSRA